jgi:hypothetical protein
MLDELYVKGGLNFLTVDKQKALGKKILNADTFDTFNELDFNDQTQMREYHAPL